MILANNCWHLSHSSGECVFVRTAGVGVEEGHDGATRLGRSEGEGDGACKGLDIMAHGM